MQIGWIDFSKEDRKKVLSIIDLLSEDGTLDELGIAPIRDGFANLFFPGTSTIQTRAKYFLVVPYVLDTLARESIVDSATFLKRLNEKEHKCGQILYAQNANGTIGSRTLKSGGWVKRSPSDIYWAGIRRYGIFSEGKMSLHEYARVSCASSREKKVLRRLGNRNDDAAEYERDDANAGTMFSASFWNLPPHPADWSWMDTLTMELTPSEAEFLKAQIECTQSDSMLAFILKNNLIDMPEMINFLSLGETNMIDAFPNDMQADYAMATAFSIFIYGARIRYNVILSDGKNEQANSEWAVYSPNLDACATLELDKIFERLKVINPLLRKFLYAIQQNMRSGDIAALDECIKKREIQLKGANRAKINRVGEFPSDDWVGGRILDYRFENAMTIVRDIFQGLEETLC